MKRKAILEKQQTKKVFNTKASITLGQKQGENWDPVHPNPKFSWVKCSAKNAALSSRLKEQVKNKKCFLSCVVVKIFLDVTISY